MSCKLEPAIWSRDTGQRIPCFDRCQLIIVWMCKIEEIYGKPRLFVSFLEYGRHVGQLRRRRRRRRRAYAPTSNTASHDNHEKINSWVSFSFPCMMSMGLRLAALRAARAPLLFIQNIFFAQTCELYSRPILSLSNDTALCPGFLGQWFNNL